MLRRLLQLFLFSLVVSCSGTAYYSTNKYWQANELRLYRNGFYEYYRYHSNIPYCGSSGDNNGQVIYGEYTFERDTLYLTTQVWNCIPTDPQNDSIYLDSTGRFIFPADSCWRDGRRVLDKFLVDGNKLVEVPYFGLMGSEYMDATQATTLKAHKNRPLRRLEKKDSIIWHGLGNELGPRGSWYNYPWLDHSNQLRDSLIDN